MDVCVGVCVAAAGPVTLAGTDVEVAALDAGVCVDVEVDVDDAVEVELAAVEEDVEVLSEESSRNCASFALASSQLFCLASNMQSTSSSFPPDITTVSSGP
jgi:hypothetical protein